MFLKVIPETKNNKEDYKPGNVVPQPLSRPEVKDVIPEFTPEERDFNIPCTASTRFPDSIAWKSILFHNICRLFYNKLCGLFNKFNFS